MNMRDLSRDDDFLSHLLVEKLGTGNVPLCVHKMDPSRRLPKVPTNDLMAIVKRVSRTSTSVTLSCSSRDVCILIFYQLVESKAAPQSAVRQAVEELLALVSPYPCVMRT